MPSTQQELIQQAIDAIGQTGTGDEARDWAAALREELRKLGTSERQHELIRTARKALAKTTSPEEARRWARRVREHARKEKER